MVKMKKCMRDRKIRLIILMVSCISIAFLKVKTGLLKETFSPREFSPHSSGVALEQGSLKQKNKGKGDLCSSTPKESFGPLDRDFYTSYQSSVLNSRKPFAIDKGFFNTVEQYYFDKKTWLDAGAGTCETMREIEKRGHKTFGIELSDVCVTSCKHFARSGQVFSAGIDNIPFPSKSFDLVWSTEVLEHIPTNLINRSVAEIVRVARRDVFLTIAMKRSGFDPPTPEKPRIHLSVMPRAFWDAMFKTHGCKVNKVLRENLKNNKFRKATFFPYICEEVYVPIPRCTDKLSAYILCYARENGNKEMCSFEHMEFMNVCFPSE